MNGFDKMLAGSLQLEEPWYVEGAEFDSEKSEIHIHVGIRAKASIPCPRCGATTKRYGCYDGERLDGVQLDGYAVIRDETALEPRVLFRHSGVIILVRIVYLVDEFHHLHVPRKCDGKHGVNVCRCWVERLHRKIHDTTSIKIACLQVYHTLLDMITLSV